MVIKTDRFPSNLETLSIFMYNQQNKTAVQFNSVLKMDISARTVIRRFYL